MPLHATNPGGLHQPVAEAWVYGFAAGPEETGLWKCSEVYVADDEGEPVLVYSGSTLNNATSLEATAEWNTVSLPNEATFTADWSMPSGELATDYEVVAWYDWSTSSRVALDILEVTSDRVVKVASEGQQMHVVTFTVRKKAAGGRPASATIESPLIYLQDPRPAA